MEGKSKFADRLGKMQSGFSAAQKQADVQSGDDVMPEGEYVGKVTAKLRESKTGNLMVNRMFVPTEGDMAGVAVFDNLIIEQPNTSAEMRARRDTLRFLNLCGYKFGQVSELEEVLEELTKEAPLVKFRVRHNPSKEGDRVFTNVDVLEYIGSGDNPGQDAGSGAGSPTEEAPAGEDLTEQLNEFLSAYGIDTADSEDAAKEAIKANAPFDGKQLTKEERALLEKAGLSDVIEEPKKPIQEQPVAPPAPARKAASAKKPVAKGKTPPARRK